MWSVYSGYLYEGVFSEKCIALGIEVEKQSQVLEEKLAERCKLAKGRPCVDFKVVDVNGKEGMFSDYVKSGKYNMLEVWACGHCRVVIHTEPRSSAGNALRVMMPGRYL